ncbi:hypothetical protein GPX89_25515 [Nocardia sp. ET3-3]|uniref:Nucleotidyltransferase family protein n=1 Tax=Nocardia terrae TaxID=2675851 RepID=A0A7K1V1T4_9NOCA|nr:hypothetical protein [Nocardia terrae]MVU80596.1 hypothetical protein [Nocardia terrae]
MARAIDRLLDTVTRTLHVLRDNDIPCALTGDYAMYARGGPVTEVHSEVDVLVRPADLARGLSALAAAGLRPPLPIADPERTTLYDHDIRVDLVSRPNYRPVTDELLDRADALLLGSTAAPVVTVADFLVDELIVADPHRLDFTRLLHIARELRAQIDWGRVRAETGASPYARAFLGLLDDLGVSDGRCEQGSTAV